MKTQNAKYVLRTAVLAAGLIASPMQILRADPINKANAVISAKEGYSTGKQLLSISAIFLSSSYLVWLRRKRKADDNEKYTRMQRNHQ